MTTSKALIYSAVIGIFVGLLNMLWQWWLLRKRFRPVNPVVSSSVPTRANSIGMEAGKEVKPHLRYEPSLGLWVCTGAGDLGFGMGHTPSEAFAEFQADEWPQGVAPPPTPWGLS